MLSLYSIYHLNLAYSAIPESQRLEVVQKCFWPLLHLAEDEDIPIAITVPAYTIEAVSELDSSWVRFLAHLIQSGKIEFIGAGYSQLIGPLVPSDVNSWNIEIGARSYQKHLDFLPELWYVNEQAYSASLVDHYTKAGAKAIIMEWNNPRTYHPEWKEEYRYYAQKAIGVDGETIPVIWNDSVAFQKFQRYVHGDIGIDDLSNFLDRHVSDNPRCFCLYGNDAEIFDFRPGRFKTEPNLTGQNEWQRIRELYRFLEADPRFSLIFPSAVLSRKPDAIAMVPLSLESAAQPIPVKKQPKYNVTRWAVTGRNSVYVNSMCYRIHDSLVRLSSEGKPGERNLESYWKDLCYLWSSDFRTHITADRWDSYLKRVVAIDQELCRKIPEREKNERLLIEIGGLSGRLVRNLDTPLGKGKAIDLSLMDGCSVEQADRFLRITTPMQSVILNCRRGLAIHELSFRDCGKKPLVGSLPHGYFSSIALSADWYTGNTVLQRPGKPQLTDLEPAATPVSIDAGMGSTGGWIRCKASVDTELGPVQKQIIVHQELAQIDVEVVFQWQEIPQGSFKTGFVTLVPESFERRSLFFATHNGGSSFEKFAIESSPISHDSPSSSVVSASHGLGATKGIVVLGDSQKAIALYVDQQVCAAMPMMTFLDASPSYFARLVLSCGEMDESRVAPVPGPIKVAWSLTGVSLMRER